MLLEAWSLQKYNKVKCEKKQSADEQGITLQFMWHIGNLETNTKGWNDRSIEQADLSWRAFMEYYNMENRKVPSVQFTVAI